MPTGWIFWVIRYLETRNHFLNHWITCSLQFIAWFMLNCLICGHVSVRVFASMSFANLVITFAFFNIFAWNFQNQCTTRYLPYYIIGIFDLGLAKKLATKFQKFPGNFWNLAAKFSKLFLFFKTLILVYPWTTQQPQSRIKYTSQETWAEQEQHNDTKTRLEIWPILSICRVFWPYNMRHLIMNQAINCRDSMIQI